VLSILHVERSDFFRKIVRDIITRAGMNYIPSSKKTDALSALENTNIDLIITSMELNDGTADELIDELNRSRHRGLPVFVITATDSLELREKLFGLGVVDYMLKQDINIERLTRYLETFVKGDELITAMRRMKIAVLDDSQVGLGIVQNIFQLNNVRNVSFYQAPEELLESGASFDMFLVDIILPGMSGEEVIIRLRRQHPQAIIIAMSSIANTKTISNVLLSGADDYLIKPFDAMIFMARLKTNVRVYDLMRVLEQRKEALQEMADYDGLTEIYNHRKIIGELRQRMDAAASGAEGSLAVILFDLDGFKKINDKWGHQTGDEVLKSFAALADRHLSRAGAVGRYGGEEFLAIANLPSVAELKSLLEDLYMHVRQLRFGVEDLRITTSAGIALWRGGNAADSMQSLLHSADMALYEAKRTGKDRYVIAE
jgi:two-component system cell cycle response regulator